MDYAFTRYLAAKRTVDDRSLNHAVRQTLLDALPTGPLDVGPLDVGPLDVGTLGVGTLGVGTLGVGTLGVLEVGAGTGTMIERLVSAAKPDSWPQPVRFHYTAVEADPLNVMEGERRLAETNLPVTIEWTTADVYEFARRMRGRRHWDLLIAHAFLDLMDAPRLLPDLFALLRPGGLFYFTINFDGLTALEPPVDPGFDEQVITLYHRTMDERRTDGRPTAGSAAGRKLLWQIPAAGGDLLAAGASDWVVFPRDGAYAADEAYFLHHILHFFESSLAGRPELDQARFQAWLGRRREQIERGELIFIAHQIDVCGRVPGR